ncbi:MAG: hypothetical protein GX060_05020 [Firmicutes bacterium]|nr:hypothetical protein [Bacillota bacterium]
MSVLAVQQLKVFCTRCRQLVDDDHECPIKHRVLLDATLAGVAGRLSDLGLKPAMATFHFANTTATTFNLSMSIVLDTQPNFAILGDLPAGWEYGWDGDRVVSLEYNDCRTCSNSVEAEARLNEVIEQFEAFLDDKDVEGTKALLLLAGP